MSKPDAWMPLYIGDYMADTMHLSGPEHGAYMLLLMHEWRTGPLPDDDKKLAAIARTTPDSWAEMSGTIREFFEKTDAGLVQPRLERERVKAAANQERRIDLARKASEKRWARKPSSIPDASAEECVTDCPTECGKDSSEECSTDARSMPDALLGASPLPSPSSSYEEEYTPIAPLQGATIDLFGGAPGKPRPTKPRTSEDHEKRLEVLRVWNSEANDRQPQVNGLGTKLRCDRIDQLLQRAGSIEAVRKLFVHVASKPNFGKDGGGVWRFDVVLQPDFVTTLAEEAGLEFADGNLERRRRRAAA